MFFISFLLECFNGLQLAFQKVLLVDQIDQLLILNSHNMLENRIVNFYYFVTFKLQF